MQVCQPSLPLMLWATETSCTHRAVCQQGKHMKVPGRDGSHVSEGCWWDAELSIPVISLQQIRPWLPDSSHCTPAACGHSPIPRLNHPPTEPERSHPLLRPAGLSLPVLQGSRCTPLHAAGAPGSQGLCHAGGCVGLRPHHSYSLPKQLWWSLPAALGCGRHQL